MFKKKRFWFIAIIVILVVVFWKKIEPGLTSAWDKIKAMFNKDKTTTTT